MTETNTNQNLDKKEEKDPRNYLDGISLLATLCWLVLGLVGFAYSFRSFIQNLPNYQ